MLTLEQLKAQIHYDPETGILTRLVYTINRTKVIGDIVGSPDSDGYLILSLFGKSYKAHILAWFYMTGEWPIQDIDHKDVNPANNKWDNLRHASRSHNLANSGKRNNNTSGLKGVSFHKLCKKWRATISINNRSKYLGLFDCPAAAHFAYMIASDIIHGEFARMS